MTPEQRAKKQAADRAYYAANKDRINARDTLRRQIDPIAKQKASDAAAKYRASPDNTIKLRYLKTRYGLTMEQFKAMEIAQAGRCKICNRTPEEAGGRWKRLHVDHDHATDRVRGLLCFDCNVMLGFARDRPTVLTKALLYLGAL